MKDRGIIQKIMMVIVVIVGMTIFFRPTKVMAACTINNQGFTCDEYQSESCYSVGGGSVGLAVYGCGYNSQYGCNGCYSHTYSCDSPCGSGPGPGPRPGPEQQGNVNCPAGTVVDYTQPISTVCSSAEQGYVVGNAQKITGCCRGKWVDTDNCWEKPSGKIECDKEWVCSQNYYTTYACVSICNTTAPVITGITTLSPTKATVNWTAGTGGSKQKIFIGANKSLVESDCVGNQSPACVVNAQNLTASQTSYTTGNVLSSGTVYYVRVINSGGSSCNSNSQTAKFLSSCLLSPSAVTKNINQTQDLISNLSSSTEITKVKYTSNSPGVASVSPANDAAYIYKTTATARSVGNATVTSDVYFGSVITCTANATVTVTSPDPWWQVKDGNIHSGSSIFSDIPSGCSGGCIPSLMTGVSGLASYLGTLGVGSGTLSQSGANWQAETVYTGTYRLKPPSFMKRPVDRAAYRKYLLHRSLY